MTCVASQQCVSVALQQCGTVARMAVWQWCQSNQLGNFFQLLLLLLLLVLLVVTTPLHSCLLSLSCMILKCPHFGFLPADNSEVAQLIFKEIWFSAGTYFEQQLQTHCTIRMTTPGWKATHWVISLLHKKFKQWHKGCWFFTTMQLVQTFCAHHLLLSGHRGWTVRPQVDTCSREEGTIGLSGLAWPSFILHYALTFSLFFFWSFFCIWSHTASPLSLDGKLLLILWRQVINWAPDRMDPHSISSQGRENLEEKGKKLDPLCDSDSCRLEGRIPISGDSFWTSSQASKLR